MSATVIAFRPSVAAAPPGPLRFTTAERQALLAIGCVPGLMAVIHQDDDGDEHCAFLPADDGHGLDSAGVSVGRRGFSVLGGGCTDLGVFADIHEAIAVARRDLTTRMTHHDPEAAVAAWRKLFKTLDAHTAE